jgi:TRAP-type transport system periplasmic protein
MKLRRRMLNSLVAVAVFAAFAGTASAQTSLRFSSEAPRSDTQFEAATKMSEVLKAKTKGALDLKIFTDSQLGTFQAAIAGVRGGTIDLAISGSGNFTGLESMIGVLDIPFLFRDSEHAYKVLDGPIGQQLLDKLAPLGMKGLAYWDNGWRQMTNSKHPITKPEDVKGIKMRTTGSPAHIEAFKELGANPVPMPIAELYTALEMKTVDGQEHPLGVFYSSKFYEVQKFVSISNHAYSALILVMNKAKFDALPADQKTAIVEAAREAGAFQRKRNAENMGTIIADLKKKGVPVVEKVEGAPFAQATANVRTTFATKFPGSGDFIKAIEAVK